MFSLRSLRIALALAALMVVAGATSAQQPWRLGVELDPTYRPGGKIQRVFEKSPAKAIELKPSFIILAVDDQLCRNADDVKKKVWGPNNAKVDLIYFDGTDYWEVTAILKAPVVVGGEFQAQNLKKVKVSEEKMKKMKLPDLRRKK